jgi:hypothetical protein
MSVRVVMPDGTVKEYPNGTTREEILRDNRQVLARAQRPEGYTPLRGGMAALRRGVTIGLSDEAAGAGTAVGQGIRAAVQGRNPLPAMAQGYQQGRAEEQGLVNQFRREAPIAALGTELVAGLGSAGPAALRAAPAAITGPRTAMQAFNAAPRPVTMAASMGAAGGENVQERATGAAIGGAVGGAAHALLGGTAGRARTADDYALDAYTRAMRQARRDPLREVAPVLAGTREVRVNPATGVTPRQMETAARRLQRAAPGGDDTMVFEALPRLNQSMQAIATVGGPGRAVLQEATEQQGQGLTRRVMGAAQQATGEQASSYQALAQRLAGERNTAATQAYDRAYAQPLTAQQQATLRNAMMARPVNNALPLLPQETAFAQRALRGAAEQAAYDVRHLRNRLQRASSPQELAQVEAELAEVLRVGNGLNAMIDGQNGYVSTRTVNYYGRALANIAQDVRADNTGAMALRSQIQAIAGSDEISPLYRAAQQQYLDDSGAIEIARQAYQAITNPSSQGAAAFRHQMETGFGGTPAQMRASALGILEGLDAALARGETRTVLTVMRSRAVQDAIRNAFADNAQTGAARLAPGNRIINRILTEAQGVNRRNRLFGNSATAERAEAVAQNTQEDGVIDFAIQSIESGGVQGPFRRVLANVARSARQPGILNPQRNEALARLGTTPLSQAGRLNQRAAERELRAQANALRRAQANVVVGRSAGQNRDER